MKFARALVSYKKQFQQHIVTTKIHANSKVFLKCCLTFETLRKTSSLCLSCGDLTYMYGFPTELEFTDSKSS